MNGLAQRASADTQLLGQLSLVDPSPRRERTTYYHLPQGLYRMEHQELGAVTVFLVPSAKNAEGVTYVATFN